MKPENVLSRQIAMVEEYIPSCWVEASRQARDLARGIPDYSHILLGGCGDSHHAAIGLSFAYGAFLECSVTAMESMSLARYAPSLIRVDPGSCLVIAISASGEVARTIEVLEVWREVGAHTLAFTTAPDSTLAGIAEHSLVLPPPEIPHGPGLLSYIGSLLSGYAILAISLLKDERHNLVDRIDQMPDLLHGWLPGQLAQAERLASQVVDGISVFLGSGPVLGSARFGSAKLIEAAGERSWAQDVEEWSHLEYFCEPAHMPTILLSAHGRARSRELEVIEAIHALGRSALISEWKGGGRWTMLEREALSPLALWAAPSAYAHQRAKRLAAQPFRGFAGGRDRLEGGGISRIRSSARIQLGELDSLNP